MKLTLDNNQRIFVVKEMYSTGNPVICNLKDLPQVVSSMNHGVDSIKEFWNGKLHKTNKKSLVDMLKAHKIDTGFLVPKVYIKI